MRSRPNKAQRLRMTVELLPRHTREAMIRGIDSNQIIVGGYTDGEGGVCPMLAAHRNGGRTSVAGFARAWDAFTNAKRARKATKREVNVLRTYLELSLLSEDNRGGSITEIAAEIRAERAKFAERDAAELAALVAERTNEAVVVPAPLSEPDEFRVTRPVSAPVRPGDANRAKELKLRRGWSFLRPARSYDVFQATLAAAEEQLSEQRASEVLDGDTADAEALDRYSLLS